MLYACLTIVLAAGAFVGWHFRGWWSKHGTPQIKLIDATGKPRATIRRFL